MTKVSQVHPRENFYLYLPWLNKLRKQDGNGSNQEEYQTSFFGNPRLKPLRSKPEFKDLSNKAYKSKRKNNLSSLDKNLKQVIQGSEKTFERTVAPFRTKVPKLKQGKEEISKNERLCQQETSKEFITPKKMSMGLPIKRNLKTIKKVVPLTKEELEQVFAKYKFKVTHSNQSIGTDESTLAGEGSNYSTEKKSDLDTRQSLPTKIDLKIMSPQKEGEANQTSTLINQNQLEVIQHEKSDLYKSCDKIKEPGSKDLKAEDAQEPEEAYYEESFEEENE